MTPRATQTKGGRTVQVAVRLDTQLLKRIDTFAKSTSAPGLSLTRADAMRMLMSQALDSAEKKKKR